MRDEMRFHIDALRRRPACGAASPPRRPSGRARARIRQPSTRIKDDCRAVARPPLARRARQDLRYAVRLMAKAPGVHRGGGAVARARHRRQHRDLQLDGRRAPADAAGRAIRSDSFFLGARHGRRPSAELRTIRCSSATAIRPVSSAASPRSRPPRSSVDGDGPENVKGQFVSGNFSRGARRADGARAAASRPSPIAPDGGADVAVISDALWARRFGRAPACSAGRSQVGGRVGDDRRRHRRRSSSDCHRLRIRHHAADAVQRWPTAALSRHSWAGFAWSDGFGPA